MTSDLPQALNQPIQFELTVRKSRFLACIEPIHESGDSQQRLSALRVQHPDARHVCFVQLLHGQVSMSDDGEPSGTAARPMLNVLQHQGLDNVLATVVRYFGGIKLGAGGLVRAYSQALSAPLHDPANAHCLAPVVAQRAVSVALPFDLEPLARRLAADGTMQVQAEYPGAHVELHLHGDAPAVATWLAALQEPARGAMQVLADSGLPE